MKKTFLSALFLCSCATINVHASEWGKLYGSSAEEQVEVFSSRSPLMRLEIRRHENKNCFNLDAYRVENGEFNSILQQPNQPLSLDEVRTRDNPFLSRLPTKIKLSKAGDNLVEIDGFSIPSGYNFDLVTNMRLRILSDIRSEKGIRVFSTYEVLGREHIKGKPCEILPLLKEGKENKEGKQKQETTQEITYGTLKQTLDSHLRTNPELFNSSKGKDIVAVLGKTGAGKSTLINYLSGKKLKTETRGLKGLIITNDPEEKSAMVIGVGKDSQTRLPQFVDVGGLLFYDLPGLDDTGGGPYELLNASFIKHIIENAKTTRLIIVAGLDEVTASRGKPFKELTDRVGLLLPASVKIDTCSSLVITKTPGVEDLIDSLLEVVDKQYLSPWLGSSKPRISQMSQPKSASIDLSERELIMRSIRSATAIEIRGLNIGALYSLEAFSGLEKALRDAMTCSIEELEKKIDADISAAKDKGSLGKIVTSSERFRGAIDLSQLITLLKPFLSESSYQSVFSSLGVERIARGLQDKAALKVKDIEKSDLEEKLRIEIAKPPKVVTKIEYRDPPTSSTDKLSSSFFEKYKELKSKYTGMTRREKALYPWDSFLKEGKHSEYKGLEDVQKSVELDLVRDSSGNPVKSNNGRLVLVNTPYIIKQTKTDLPIDASHSYTKRWVYVSTKSENNHDGNKWQQWYFLSRGSGYNYSILQESEVEKLPMPIDAPDSGWAYASDNRTHNHPSNLYQQWYFVNADSDNYWIRQTATTNYLEAQSSGSRYLYGTKTTGDKWSFR